MTPAIQPDFLATLELCFSNSHDMPELRGAQSARDLVETQLASDPTLSAVNLLGSFGTAPAAVIMLSEDSDRALVEIRYLGLVPGLRGRGMGREVLGQALEVSLARQALVEVAVDSRNERARRLYRRGGFYEIWRREVYLSVLAS
jgi:ribosomal protein S18 acetylase RimI-like enzyme